LSHSAEDILNEDAMAGVEEETTWSRRAEGGPRVGWASIFTCSQRNHKSVCPRDDSKWHLPPRGPNRKVMVMVRAPAIKNTQPPLVGPRTGYDVVTPLARRITVLLLVIIEDSYHHNLISRQLFSRLWAVFYPAFSRRYSGWLSLSHLVSDLLSNCALFPFLN
jgi:hypothetical protein